MELLGTAEWMLEMERLSRDFSKDGDDTGLMVAEFPEGGGGMGTELLFSGFG